MGVFGNYPASYAEDLYHRGGFAPTPEEKLECCMGKPLPDVSAKIKKYIDNHSIILGMKISYFNSLVKQINQFRSAACPDVKSNPRLCDQSVQSFCDIKKDDPRCACYVTDAEPGDSAQEQELKANPMCFSNKCLMKGYHPAALKGLPCPKVTICKQQLGAIGNSNISEKNVNVVNCGGGDSSGSGGNDTAAIIAQQDADKRKQQILYFIFAIVGIIVLYVLFGPGKSDNYDDDNSYPAPNITLPQ